MQFRKKKEKKAPTEEAPADEDSLNERNSMALRIRAIEAELASLQVRELKVASQTTITVLRKDDPLSK